MFAYFSFQNKKIEPSLRTFQVAVLVVSAILCVVSVLFGQRGFEGYDMSPLIDSAWRVYSGQVPGKDFIVTFPPSLYLSGALCFRLFGVTWPALTVGASWFSLLMIILGLRLSSLAVRTRHSPEVAWILGAYTAAQLIPLFITDTLWHSTLAMNFSVYAVFATYVLLGELQEGGRQNREALFHLTVAVTALWLSKPNIAWPAILLVYIVLLYSGMRKALLAGSIASSILLAAATLSSVHVSLFGMLSSYFGLRSRLNARPLFSGILYDLNSRFALANIIVFVVIAPLCGILLSRLWAHRQDPLGNGQEILALGSILISTIGMATNYQFKISDTPLLVMGFAIVSISGRLSGSDFRRWWFVSACTLVILSLYFGRIRLGFQLHGEWAIEGCNRVWFNDELFGHMVSCKNMPDVLSEVSNVLKQNPHASVFFGPGLEFLYASHRISAPLSLPDWWDAGSSYPLKDAARVTSAWSKNSFDLLIFNRDELHEKLPSPITRLIAERYVESQNTRFIRVYTRVYPTHSDKH